MRRFSHVVILLVSHQMSSHEITFKTNLSDPIRTRADFTYKITPKLIFITDTGPDQRSVAEDRKRSYKKSSTGTSLHLSTALMELERVVGQATLPSPSLSAPKRGPSNSMSPGSRKPNRSASFSLRFAHRKVKSTSLIRLSSIASTGLSP